MNVLIPEINTEHGLALGDYWFSLWGSTSTDSLTGKAPWKKYTDQPCFRRKITVSLVPSVGINRLSR